MNVKKTIKKIVALGTGATMVGATMMGAMAALDDYPDAWISDGAFNGKIVVGQDAATSDVLGAIDIAASLQAASTVETKVDVPGAAGKTTLQGDAVEIGESSDLLTINEPLGDVKETITEFELGALKGGVISTDEGTTNYKQYLRFKTANATELFPTSVIYGENDADAEEVGDWLYISEEDVDANPGGAFFEWQIEFEEGLESGIETATGGGLELADLEDEVFNIFGTDFVFVDSEIDNTTGGTDPDLTLEFLAGDVTDVLQEGETKTYTIDGKDYEVTLVFVSNPNSGSVKAKLSVNGELTDALEDGDTDILSDGLELGIQEILVSERGGVAEFFLGAQKVQFRDTNTSDEAFDNDVEITEENIEEGHVSIQGQVIGGSGVASGNEYEITNIKYKLTADAITGTTNIYVPPGHGVREFLDEPEGMLSPNFDIRYEGFLEVSEVPVSIEASGDDEYKVQATNRQGNSYEIPYVEVLDDASFRFGEDDDEGFEFIEDSDFDTNYSADAAIATSQFTVDRDDHFLLWNARDDVWDDQATSHVLQYQSLDKSQQVVTFEDAATGTKEFTYSSDSHANVLGKGNLVVGGNNYKVYVSDDNSSNNPLAIDLNADGDVAGDKSKFTVQGGGVIDFDQFNNTHTSDIATSPGTDVGFVLHTEASEFDETDEGNEEILMNITSNSDKEVTLSFLEYRRTGVTASSSSMSTINRTTDVFIEGTGNVSASGTYDGFKFDPTEPDDMEDHELEMTDYGVAYDFYNPSDDPEEVTLMYPQSERGVQVFVTAGQVTATKGGPGGVSTTQVNPIAVGLAVLDVNAPAVGTENLIVVGGPAVNSVSAELLGVEYPATGDAASDLGFEAGKAIVKMYEDQNAILVAGYNADDTLGASYVLADYSDYDLTGTEVEVMVTDLDTISVNPVE